MPFQKYWKYWKNTQFHIITMKLPSKLKNALTKMLGSKHFWNKKETTATKAISLFRTLDIDLLSKGRYPFMALNAIETPYETIGEYLLVLKQANINLGYTEGGPVKAEVVEMKQIYLNDFLTYQDPSKNLKTFLFYFIKEACLFIDQYSALEQKLNASLADQRILRIYGMLYLNTCSLARQLEDVRPMY